MSPQHKECVVCTRAISLLSNHLDWGWGF